MSDHQMIKVFIASPYKAGDVAVNVKFQMDVFNQLVNLKFIPYATLHYHFQHMAHPKPSNTWNKLEKEWLKNCDCVLRIGGESKGSDDIVVYAGKLNIPVFYSIKKMCAHYDKR